MSNYLNFSPLSFINRMSKFGFNFTFKAADFTVEIDNKNPQLMPESEHKKTSCTDTQLPVFVFSPILPDNIAELFNADSVRLGCRATITFVFASESSRPLSIFLSNGADTLEVKHHYFFEVTTGKTVKSIPIEELDQCDTRETLILKDIFSNNLMPLNQVQLAVEKHCVNTNQVEIAARALRNLALELQVRKNIGMYTYQADLLSNDKTVKSEPFKADNITNAVEVAALLFLGFIPVGVNRIF